MLSSLSIMPMTCCLLSSCSTRKPCNCLSVWFKPSATSLYSLLNFSFSSIQLLLPRMGSVSIKNLPSHPIILLPIRPEERRFVFHCALSRPARQRVVHIGFVNAAFLQVLDVFPAEGDARFLWRAFSFWCVYAVEGAFGEFLLVGFSGQAYAYQAFAGGEDDAAGLVVVGFGFVLAHDGELDSVDGEQFFQREAKGLGDEDVDFYQGLAAGVVGAQGVVALPLGGEVGEEVLRQRGDGFAGGPALLVIIVSPMPFPKLFIVSCQAIQSKNPKFCWIPEMPKINNRKQRCYIVEEMPLSSYFHKEIEDNRDIRCC